MSALTHNQSKYKVTTPKPVSCGPSPVTEEEDKIVKNLLLETTVLEMYQITNISFNILQSSPVQESKAISAIDMEFSDVEEDDDLCPYSTVYPSDSSESDVEDLLNSKRLQKVGATFKKRWVP